MMLKNLTLVGYATLYLAVLIDIHSIIGIIEVL